MIHRSPLPDVDIPDEALTTYALHRARELGDKPALVDGPTGRALTYAALEQGVRSLAGGLVARGFAKGDVLALMAPNVPEYAVVFHRHGVRGRCDHHHQPDLHRAGGPPPAPRLRRHDPRHDPAVP